MTKYERLVAEYDQEIDIEERKMKNDALYCDNVIWINERLTNAEKLSVVAEEIGHYETSSGNILDQSVLSNVKQERLARKWAYEKVIPLEEILQAVKNGIKEIYDLAEHFDVSEEFMKGCLSHYGLINW